MPVQDKAAYLVICTAQELLNKLGKVTRQFGLSMTQLQILHVLDMLSDEKVTVNMIRNLLVEDSPNVSRSINKLVEKNLAGKKRSTSDQRVVYVAITADGRRVHEACDKQMIGKTIDLSDKKSAALADLLMQI